MATRYDDRAGSWLFVIDLPRGIDGQRRQLFRRGFATEPQAARAEEQARKQFAEASLAADGTVAAELTQWLEDRELDLAVTTLSNYRNIVTKYVIPHLGPHDVYDLDKRLIHDFYKKLLRKGGRKGAGLSSDTVRTVHRVLMKALKDMGIKIAGVIEPRRSEREHKGRKGVWTAEQCQQFLAVAATDRLHAAWVLAIVCAMRRGEIAGLKRAKVDLDRKKIMVHWQRAVASGEVNGGVVEKEPKGKSKRTIAIGDMVCRILAKHLEEQAKEIAAAGIAYRHLGYVFCKEDGRPYHPKYFTDRFRALCIAAGVPVIVLHDGRASSATVGADNGVPQHSMQRRLGHAQGRTTGDFYIDVLPDAERRAADVMENTILGGLAA